MGKPALPGRYQGGNGLGIGLAGLGIKHRGRPVLKGSQGM
jgi:hypothetical protein